MMAFQANKLSASGRLIIALVFLSNVVLAVLSGVAHAQQLDNSDAYQNSIAIVSDANVTKEVIGRHLVALDADDLAEVADIWQRRVQTNLARIAEGVTQLDLVEEEEVDALVDEIMNDNRRNISNFQNYTLVVNALGRKGADQEVLDKHQDFMQGFISELLLSYRWIEIAHLAWDWALSFNGGLRVLNLAIQAALIVGGAFLVGRILNGAARRWLQTQGEEKGILQILVPALVRWLVIILGFFVAMALMGFNIGVTTAVIGGVGFLIAFVLQSFFQSVIGGFLLKATNPYSTGDIISINQTIGKVVDVNVVATKLKTFDNRMVQIPNQAIWQGSMENFTKYRVRRVDLVFGISYEADVELAKKVLKDMIAADNRCLKSPEARVFVGELAPSSVNVFCRPWVATDDYWDVLWDFTERGKTLLQNEGISIAYPQMDVHVHTTSDTVTQNGAKKS